MLAKDDESDKKGEKRKTAAQKLHEYEEEFHQIGVNKIPAWFYPWRRYAGWLDFVRGEGERSKVEGEGERKRSRLKVEVKGEAVAVAREFGRIVHTGTMGYERQMIRPAHEVAVGLWLARLGR